MDLFISVLTSAAQHETSRLCCLSVYKALAFLLFRNLFLSYKTKAAGRST